MFIVLPWLQYTMARVFCQTLAVHVGHVAMHVGCVADPNHPNPFVHMSMDTDYQVSVHIQVICCQPMILSFL